jgi:hypothetical protein
MATVKFSMRLREDLRYHLNSIHNERWAQARKLNFQRIQEAGAETARLLTSYVQDQGDAPRESYIDGASWAEIGRINGRAIDYPIKSEQQAKLLILMFNQSLEFREEIGGSYRATPNRREYRWEDCTYDELATSLGVDNLDVIDYMVAPRYSEPATDPATTRILLTVPVALPLPAGATWLTDDDCDVPDEHLQTMQLSLYGQCPNLTLLNATISPSKSYRRPIYGRSAWYSLDVAMPSDMERKIRDGIQAIASRLTEVQRNPKDEFGSRIMELSYEYSTVNALVRDVPNVFQVLPTEIQNKLRQETEKRKRRAEILTPEEREKLKRQATLATLG